MSKTKRVIKRIFVVLAAFALIAELVSTLCDLGPHAFPAIAWPIDYIAGNPGTALDCTGVRFEFPTVTNDWKHDIETTPLYVATYQAGAHFRCGFIEGHLINGDSYSNSFPLGTSRPRD